MKIDKILIITLLIIAVTSIFNSSYASDIQAVDVSYYDDIINNLGHKQYFLAKSKDSQYFSLFVYPCNNDYRHWNYETDDIYFYMKNNVLTCRNATKNEETSHFADYSYNGSTVRTVHGCWAYGGDFFIKEHINTKNEVYTSTPIYSDINKKEVFFFKKLTTVITITEITKVEQILEIMTKVIKMILPIGLTIFGILLLIYVIRLLILRVT